MDDNYSLALTDRKLPFIECREENGKIGGVLSLTAAILPFPPKNTLAIIKASLTNQ